MNTFSDPVRFTGSVGVKDTEGKELGLNDITASAAEINKLDGMTATKAELSALHSKVAGITFTIGSEAGNSINVGLQLEDADGNDISSIAVLWAYLSDSAAGDGITATAPDGNIAVGTDGTILGELVADKIFLIQSESDGDIDLDIGESSTGTWYLAVVLPNGSLAMSGAITFA